MSILKKAEITTAFFKCGILGFQGSGKTFTATLIAQGIGDSIKNKKIAYFDTETGSDFLLDRLKADGFETYQVKSRSFSDLLTTIQDCEKDGVGMLIIDSITHVWRELCEAYQEKLGRKRLQFQDWAIIKKEWGRYTDAFVNSILHIIVCGRAGFEYDYDFAEDGSKDLIKTGTKMKVESEFGFEPSLVIEMERVSRSREEFAAIPKDQKTRRQTFQPKIGSGWTHRAHILKDRTDSMNGQIIDNPTFKDFRPHFDHINIGGKHLGVDSSRSSQERFDIEGKPEWQKKKEQIEVAIAEIKGLGLQLWPSASAEDKKARADFLQVAFGVRSLEAVEKLEFQKIQANLARLDAFQKAYSDTSLEEPRTIQEAWEVACGGN